ncbi:uncharacterized protein PFL1_04622 [Pseudozyma flocculosa PF-1]|uniref:Related to NRK1 - Nicotinamide riboside kinase n=2 Tax=Pseudozyma flocculosa TaxID=84751 RepID=A0A5C3FE82_9BASI|nr:uncharacterized protein PFL1_04622 [Pseudozyma flocculosa PF-1]EPQ27878.1 hypothetical protein PFL1_04622 [Pseudozyma flocculosa PF-1]SPO41659.1 related to NRK1 - Nicotinamide riboside kinase [Pseudozyma flocculosa]
MTDDAAPLIVGVGGATCSGKTTLSKHILRLLLASHTPSFILHQDDFAPPEATLPLHPESGERDWDAPRTAIDYARMHETLRYIKTHRRLPPQFSSHDHLNKQPPCPIPSSQERRWIESFRDAAGDEGDEAGRRRRDVVLADGFLLYYDARCRDEIDVRLFLRVRRDMLLKRREERNGYATAEGTVWQDPPGYFESVVWPAYVEAHRNVFVDGQLDSGAPAPPVPGQEQADGGPIPDLVLLEGDEEAQPHSLPEPLRQEVQHCLDAGEDVSVSMALMVETACRAILEQLTATR